MDRKIAEELVNAVRLFEEPTNVLNEITNKIVDEEERKKFRQYMAEIVALLTIDLLNPIINEYPDLDPYKDHFKKTE
ncbi:MAG: hypothetical protein ACAH80_12290 [Alphaproteobacteria bacterium]